LGCGYHSSILAYLQQRVGERACSIVFKVPARVQLQKVKDGRVEATAATVPRPFCSQSFQKWGVPCSGMNILAGCTTMNFEHGTPNAHVMRLSHVSHLNQLHHTHSLSPRLYRLTTLWYWPVVVFRSLLILQKI